MALPLGFKPRTQRLTAACSITELQENGAGSRTRTREDVSQVVYSHFSLPLEYSDMDAKSGFEPEF